MIVRLLKKYPLFAFLLPLFFVGHGFAQYAAFIPAASVVSLGLKYLLASLGLFAFFFLLYKKQLKAGLAVFCTFFFFCFFGACHDFLRGFLRNSFFIRYIFLLPLLTLAFVALLLLIKRKTISPQVVLYLNVVLLVLLFIDGGTLVVKSITQPSTTIAAANCSTCSKPDVYFIVVDGYAGREQLQKDFAFSDAVFLDSLKALGFRIQEKSRSNYVRTEFSIASMLNMEYHQRKDYNVTDETLFYCYRQIARNKAISAFLEQGYAVVNNSIFDINNQRSPVRNTFLVTGADLIESETLLARLRRDVYIPFLMTYLKGTSLYRRFIFQALESDKVLSEKLHKLVVERSQQPRFIYTHFLMTHFPYYYQPNGRFNKAEEIRADNYQNKNLYLGNLQFAGKRLLSVVRNILNASPKPPVIVLVSDHGFRYAADPAQAFSALSAVYLPGRQYSQYYDSLSGVNQFRVLLNTLFQQHLPLLEDRNGEVPAKDQRE
jgi:hypothetical protein